jgi:cytochrome oxidase Cu insertion factor (SCO1/SenC/PrrC family)
LTSGTPTRAAGSPARRSLKPLIAIFLVTLAPIVAAFVVYANPQWWPSDRSNYGALVQPQRPMPAANGLALTRLDGTPFDLNALKGKWLLLAADGGACPDACARKLFITRNAHASQGKDVDRLLRVWFITDDAPVPEKVIQAYQGTIMVRAKPAQLAAFLLGTQRTKEQAADHVAAQAAGTAGASADVTAGAAANAGANAGAGANAAAALAQPIWVIDPLGNLMMQYPPDADGSRVRDDIKKLVYNSSIG